MNTLFTEQLKKLAWEYQIDLNEEMLEQFARYADTLLEWNQKMNLTAITDPEEMVIKHFVDSLLLLHREKVKERSSLIDVGTGAGFPAVPVKIARPDIQISLLDSLNKRIVFLKELSQILGIDAEYIHGRAEELGRRGEYREQFDYASARAVADLRELSEYCLPFVKVGGRFIALKGYEVEEELKGAKKAIHLLGGEVAEVKKYILPNENRRSIVIIEKISQTNTKYPRPSAKIAKKPLV